MYSGYQRYLFLRNLNKRFPNTIIADDIIIHNPELVKIGTDVIISPGCYLNCGYLPHLGNISIGNGSIVGYNACLYAGGGKITIENNVDLGINCVVSTQSRSLLQDPVQHRKNFEHTFGEILIGEGTLVGSNVNILEGTVLGKYCNVISGAVVQGVYPDRTTLVGNPSRPLPRTNFN